MNKILVPVQPIINPIIQETVNPSVDNLSETIKPSDIVYSSMTIGAQAGVTVIDKASELVDSILSVLSSIPTIINDDTFKYIIVSSILLSVYLFIPNKKKILKSNNYYITHNLNLPLRPPPPWPQIPANIKPTAIRPILLPVPLNNTISIKQP